MINPAPLLKTYLLRRKASRKAPSAHAGEVSNNDWWQRCGVKVSYLLKNPFSKQKTENHAQENWAKLKAAELRNLQPSKAELKRIRRREIYFVLDNILDTYNTGGIFRLADALGVKKIYLCGVIETPPNTRIKKASINTTEWVKWEYKETAVSAIKDLRLKIKDIQVIAVEQNSNSVQYDKIDYKLPTAFVVGNETDGMSKESLKACDQIAEIPMWGINTSLNVIISLGIVSYHATKNL